MIMKAQQIKICRVRTVKAVLRGILQLSKKRSVLQPVILVSTLGSRKKEEQVKSKVKRRKSRQIVEKNQFQKPVL